MSTNYYARVNLGGKHSIEITTELHIGKTGGGASFSGDWFQSFEDWRRFLEFNADKVTIINEYKAELTLEELVEIFESYDTENRRRQFDWIAENSPTNLRDYWLDGEGYTFSKGEFF